MPKQEPKTSTVAIKIKTIAGKQASRFMKEFSFHDPYGQSKFYKKAVETADSTKAGKTHRYLWHAATAQSLSLLVLCIKHGTD